MADAVSSSTQAQREGHESLDAMLLQVAEGDRIAFARLYRLTSSKLFGICLRVLRDHGAAEEVLQDVYTTVWRQAETFDPLRAGAMTWMTTLARNRSIDRLRQRRDVPLEEEAEGWVVDTSPTPADHAEQSQERLRLSACISQLTAPHAQAIREAFYSGATYSELAERANVPLGTMKSWIRRSLILLKTCLER